MVKWLGSTASSVAVVGVIGVVTDFSFRSIVQFETLMQIGQLNRDWRVNVRYTVRLKIAGQKDIVQKIKLIDAR